MWLMEVIALVTKGSRSIVAIMDMRYAADVRKENLLIQNKRRRHQHGPLLDRGQQRNPVIVIMVPRVIVSVGTVRQVVMGLPMELTLILRHS